MHRLGLAVLFGVLLTAPLGCDKDEDKKNDAPLSVAITRPTAKAYVRDSLAFSVRVEGGTPSELNVDLLKDGEPLTRLHQPYSYTWDTKSVPEGTYSMSVRVSRGDTSVTSEPLEVVVDRTAPTVVSRHPVLSGLAEWDGAISFTVSEPLAPDSVEARSVELRQQGGLGTTEVSVKVSLSSDGTTVDVVPDSMLTLPANLSLVLKPTMRDLAGNPLGVPTEEWTWEARTWRLLKTPVQAGHGVLAYPPSLVNDGQGRPTVSFVEVEVGGRGRSRRTGRWSRAGRGPAGSASRLQGRSARTGSPRAGAASSSGARSPRMRSPCASGLLRAGTTRRRRCGRTDASRSPRRRDWP